MKKFLLVLIAATLASPAAFAYPIPPPACTMPSGQVIPYRYNPNLNDGASAKLDEWGMPIIQYNPANMGGHTVPAQYFLYTHECSHHLLGQVVAIASGQVPYTVAIEQAADCFAISWLVSHGVLGLQDVAVIQQDMQSWPGDQQHYVGPVRAQNLGMCLAQASNVGQGSTYQNVGGSCGGSAGTVFDVGAIASAMPRVSRLKDRAI